VPEEYPSWQPVAQNKTHWAGLIRCEGDCPVKAEILAAIPYEGKSTYEQMLASLDADTLARFRAVHPAEESRVIDLEGKTAMFPTGPIVSFAGDA
jgi:hypothetical protein